MTTYVVDASIVAKWFFLEEHSEACGQLISAVNQLLAPDLVWSEVGSVLWKRFRRGEITTEETTQLVADFLRMPIETVPAHDLLGSAIEIALATGLTVYDAMYLALAISRGCQMVTADEKLLRLVAKSPYAQTVWHASQLRR